jgi:hypothetical protein
MIKPQKKSIGRPKSNPKAPRYSSTPNHKTLITTTQNLPLVVGNIYMKVENFDLEELSVIFIFNFHCFKTFYIFN